MKNTWSPQDRQRFADRDVLRAASVPGVRRNGPGIDEWADDLEDMGVR